MAGGDVASSPVCLIENDDNGQLCVRKEAKDVLDRIREPVVVVSVVGLYRKGKSYLMNRLAGRQSGFALGNTVESKTKGIWMWCVPHPTVEGHTLVLLDTEGLGDVKKGDSKHDGWIFCLAVLLSSTLVYNSQGTIDNDAVQKLHYIIELAEQIKIRSPSSSSADEEMDDSTQFVCFFPSFVWAVRDFTLELEIKGKKATEDEYLNFALELQKGVSRKINEYNLPRECILHYFPSRKCFVFPSPASPENMKHLESLDDRDLEPNFLEVTERFCDYIFNGSAVKTLKGGHRVTGKVLGGLAQIYADTINRGDVPCLDNAVIALANLENQAAVETALKVYQSGMEEVKNKFPVNMNDVTCEHQKFSHLATSEFTKLSFKDVTAEYLEKLEKAVATHYTDLLKQNEKSSEETCRDLLKNLSSDMNKRLQDGEYSQPGGYEVYCTDRDKIVAKYRSEPNKGMRAEAVLNEFLSEREAEANSILYTDTQLTENDKKIEEEKERAARIEQKCKEEEEKRIEAERLMEVENERLEDVKKQMTEKFNKELEQQQEEMNAALEKKMKLQEEMMNKGFKEKADLLNEEINILKNQKPTITAVDIIREFVMPLLTSGLQLIPSIFMHKSTMKALKRV